MALALLATACGGGGDDSGGGGNAAGGHGDDQNDDARGFHDASLSTNHAATGTVRNSQSGQKRGRACAI